jgi:initiation factor 1A
MPKNKGSGGKKFKQNKSNHHTFSIKNMAKREESDEYYGIVTKTLGNCRFMVHIIDTKKDILCTLKKSIRKKMHVQSGTLVLLIVREYQQDHGDIIYPYDTDEVNTLVEEQEVPENIHELLSRETSIYSDTVIGNVFDIGNGRDENDSSEDEEINIDEI